MLFKSAVAHACFHEFHRLAAAYKLAIAGMNNFDNISTDIAFYRFARFFVILNLVFIANGGRLSLGPKNQGRGFSGLPATAFACRGAKPAILPAQIVIHANRILLPDAGICKVFFDVWRRAPRNIGRGALRLPVIRRKARARRKFRGSVCPCAPEAPPGPPHTHYCPHVRRKVQKLLGK